MKKTVRTITFYLFAAVLAVFCLFSSAAGSFLNASIAAYADELTGLLDKTSIEKDLEQLDLSGISASDGLQLVYFGEVGYKESGNGDYGIYFYIYNPDETEFSVKTGDNTVSMGISFNSDGEPDVFANLSLTFIDRTEDHRFYKYRLTDAERMYEYANGYSLHRGCRRYDVAGMQLLSYKAALPQDYATPATFTYTGFAKGYGPDVFAESTLQCTRTERKVITFDGIQQTYYHYPQDTENFAEIKTVYFSIPNEVLDYYGGIYSIQAEYYEYDLQPVAVVQSDEVYNEFSPHIGESIPIDNDFDYCFYVIEDEAGSGTVTVTEVDWYYGHWSGAQMLSGAYKDKLIYLFNAPCDVDDYTISRNALLTAMEDYTKKFGSGNAYGGFNDDLFMPESSGYTGKTYIDISGDDLFDLEGFDAGNVLENWLYSMFQGYDNPPIENIEPIHPVSESDLIRGDLSNELYIAPQDEEEFINYCMEQMKQNKTVYMFRYKVDDYADKESRVKYTGGLSLFPLDEKASARYVTVDLGFDIISLGFQTDNGLMIVPVVSDPINVIPDLQPGKEILDNTNGVSWMTIACILTVSVAGIIITRIVKVNLNNAGKRRNGKHG